MVIFPPLSIVLEDLTLKQSKLNLQETKGRVLIDLGASLTSKTIYLTINLDSTLFPTFPFYSSSPKMSGDFKAVAALLLWPSASQAMHQVALWPARAQT